MTNVLFVYVLMFFVYIYFANAILHTYSILSLSRAIINSTTTHKTIHNRLVKCIPL